MKPPPRSFPDASRSGVFHAADDGGILAATRGPGIELVRIDLRTARSKQALIGAIAAALAFPDWFGGNWDALEDCLCDLSWRKAAGRVLLIEGADAAPGDALGVLRDVLEAAAAYWAARGSPFYAVLLGERNVLALPALMRSGA